MAMLKSFLLLFIVFSMGDTDKNITRDVNGLEGLDVGSDINCPATWIKHELQCYKFFSHPAKWITAEKNCQSLGANLASVRNKLENDFLLSLLSSSSSSSTPTWIGAHNAVEGHWLWSDGTVFLYSHWCTGEPNNPNPPDNCLEINFSSDRCWNDHGCSHIMSYICAKDL